MRMDVESYLKLLNKSTRGNVYLIVTHDNGSGVILETVD
jgi:hypothetical protein